MGEATKPGHPSLFLPTGDRTRILFQAGNSGSPWPCTASSTEKLLRRGGFAVTLEGGR